MPKLPYIINILRNYSSKEKPLSLAEITKLCNINYDPVGGNNFINASTTRRALTNYITESIYLNDNPEVTQEKNKSKSANFRIHILHKNTSGYIDVTDDYGDSDTYLPDNASPSSNKRPKEPTAYYYYEPQISFEDIANLINMIETHPYYTTEEVITLTSSIKSIAPGYFEKDAYYKSSMRSDNTTLLENLHYLHQYISKGEDVQIEYSYYDENKELVPRDGYPLTVTPYKIIWSNGYCYLAAYSPKRNNIAHYRVDRITYIADAGNESAKPNTHKENPVKDSLEYTKKHPVMMSGDTADVSILCKKNNSMVNSLLDSFGMDIIIKSPSAQTIKTISKNGTTLNPEEWLDVKCPSTNPEGVALWAKQHCTECIIYEPYELAQRTKLELEEAAKRYYF